MCAQFTLHVELLALFTQIAVYETYDMPGAPPCMTCMHAAYMHASSLGCVSAYDIKVKASYIFLHIFFVHNVARFAVMRND